MGTPPNKKGSLYKQNASKLLNSARKEGSFGFYQIHMDVLSFAFKRIGGAGSSEFIFQDLALKTITEISLKSTRKRIKDN